MEVYRKYNRSVDKLIGKEAMKRLRPSLMKKIPDGEFNQLACALLSTEFKFELSSIDREFPLEMQTNQLNEEMRIALYQKQRDLLVKLAPTKLLNFPIDAEKILNKDIDGESYFLTWDLKINLEHENVPE
jgi:hypothetical protein